MMEYTLGRMVVLDWYEGKINADTNTFLSCHLKKILLSHHNAMLVFNYVFDSLISCLCEE